MPSGLPALPIVSCLRRREEDHFLAALQLGGLSARFIRLSLVAPAFTIHTLCNEQRIFQSRPGATVSVFSHSARSLGVRLRGLSFGAEGLTLSHDRPLGVSNQALGNRFLAGVREGRLMIYIEAQGRTVPE